MLAGESRISSNMTIFAFYRTQFNVPWIYLCLSEIKLAYLLPLVNIGLFKWNHLAVASFSLSNYLVIYLDFLFNGSTFQRLKVSRPIILASTRACFKENSSLHISIPKAGTSLLNDLFYQKFLFIQQDFRMTFFATAQTAF